jgi:hypothetical protein
MLTQARYSVLRIVICVPDPKLQKYHEILDAMLGSVVRLQSKGGVPFSFTYHGKQYDMNLRVFLMFIIGDTKGHDKLCGHYNSQALQMKQVCRHCDIPTIDCDNAFYPWQHVKPDVVHALVVSNDLSLTGNVKHYFCSSELLNIKHCIGRSILQHCHPALFESLLSAQVFLFSIRITSTSYNFPFRIP